MIELSDYMFGPRRRCRLMACAGTETVRQILETSSLAASQQTIQFHDNSLSICPMGT